MSDTVMPFRLTGISPKAYEHPADRAATAALKRIPGFDAAVRKLIELQYERAYRQVLLGSSVRLGPDQLPEIWAAHERAVAALDLPETPDLYLTQFPMPNAAAIGSARPMILLTSEVVDRLAPEEIAGVIGHELGHVLSEHMLYRTCLLILMQVTLPRMPMVAGLPVVAIRSALLEWSRAAELSCDRAATLVTRDPLVMCRVLMVFAGGSASRQLNIDAFLRQAGEYREWESGWDRARRFFVELELTHDYPVRRASELMTWVQSGDYDRIVGGDFPKRTDPVGLGGYAMEGYEYYLRRFQAIMRDAYDSATWAGARLSNKLEEWLRTGKDA